MWLLVAILIGLYLPFPVVVGIFVLSCVLSWVLDLIF